MNNLRRNILLPIVCFVFLVTALEAETTSRARQMASKLLSASARGNVGKVREILDRFGRETFFELDPGVFRELSMRSEVW